MIRTDHVKQEIEKAEKILQKAEPSLQAIFKLVTVVIKIVLNNRRNTAKIMENLKIEADKPTKKEVK